MRYQYHHCPLFWTIRNSQAGPKMYIHAVVCSKILAHKPLIDEGSQVTVILKRHQSEVGDVDGNNRKWVSRRWGCRIYSEEAYSKSLWWEISSISFAATWCRSDNLSIAVKPNIPIPRKSEHGSFLGCQLTTLTILFGRKMVFLNFIFKKEPLTPSNTPNPLYPWKPISPHWLVSRDSSTVSGIKLSQSCCGKGKQPIWAFLIIIATKILKHHEIFRSHFEASSHDLHFLCQTEFWRAHGDSYFVRSVFLQIKSIR